MAVEVNLVDVISQGSCVTEQESEFGLDSRSELD